MGKTLLCYTVETGMFRESERTTAFTVENWEQVESL